MEKKMKFYELDEYIFIIYLTDFTQIIRTVKKDKLEHYIELLNNNETVYDYVLTKKIDFDYQ